MQTLFHLIKLIWEHRQAISVMIEKLPGTLRDTGQNVEQAGKWAITASELLKNDDPNVMTFSQLLNLLSTNLGNIETKLREVTTHLDDVSSFIGQIQIPNIVPTQEHLDLIVWQGNVVTGITMNNVCPFYQVKAKIDQTSNELKGTADQLDSVADYLISLENFAITTASHAENIGKALEDGGQKLQTVFQE
jgi:methyl-accepting chemotaxis protein